MIILDTNVISEVMRGPRSSPVVVSWLRSLVEAPVTTVINRAEIMAGLALLPAGRRKDSLTAAARSAFDQLGAVLPLADECADAYAGIVAARRGAGRPIGAMDALIASIAMVSGATLATRDGPDFDGLGLTLVDPWAARSPSPPAPGSAR